MEERNKGLIIFGIILLAIGLVASFYSQREYYPFGFDYEMIYPYQTIGILLDVAGIVFVALGLLYPDLKTKEKHIMLISLFSKLFWLFLVVTVAFVLYIVFVPSPHEWGVATGELQKDSTGNYVSVPNATSFPNNFNWTNLVKAELRHFAVSFEHINGSFLINTINFAFLTMFIRNIGKTVEKQLGSDGEGMVKMYVYVEWAMGSLISGILYFSSSVNALELTTAFTNVVIVVVFALVSYYVLSKLRSKLMEEEDGDKKKEALLKMKNQNGKLRVTDD